jgi:tripartite-type tricarboxylate transporter receptor subunit TctC
MRLSLFTAAALAALAFAPVDHAAAQSGGDKPVSLIVPFSPGGGTDILSRMLAPKLAEKLGTSVVVENRPGAAGAIAAQHVARSAPDGRTLLVGSTSEIGVNPSLYPKLPYDVARDFAPVAALADTPMVLVVNPASPIKTAQDLVTRAKASPGQLLFASAGVGSGAHLAAELFFHVTGTKLSHVPYKGVGPAMAEIVGTQKDMMIFTTLPSSTSFARSGQLRVVAVSSKERMAIVPDIPTFIESGVPGYEVYYWYGLMAPSAIPIDTRRRIHAAVNEILKQPDTLASLSRQGLQPTLRTAEEFDAFIKADMARWAVVVKAADIKPDQ